MKNPRDELTQEEKKDNQEPRNNDNSDSDQVETADTFTRKLYAAVETNNVEKMRALLNLIRNRFQMTLQEIPNEVTFALLRFATESNHVEMIRFLVKECGIDPNQTYDDEELMTPLHFAAEHGHVEVMRVLVKEYDANPNAKNIDGLTPLHFAAKHGHVEVMDVLVNECGANPNAKDTDGSTPLHLAASKGQVEVVRLLVKMSITNSNPATAAPPDNSDEKKSPAPK